MKEKKPLRILKITEYKGFHILIQQFIKINVFQFIIFDPKKSKFYQGFNIITPKGGKSKPHTDEDLIGITGLMLDYALTTVEALASSNEEMLKENEKGAAIVEILETANKGKKKKSN